MSSHAEQMMPESGRETVTVELDRSDREQMQNAAGMLVMAQGFAVASQADYDEGAQYLREIKQRRNELDAKRKSITRPLDEAKKRIMDLFRPPIETLDKAKGEIEGSMSAWYREQERQRREAEARAREEARREEEKRRKAVERKAEAARKKGDEERAQQIIDEAEQAPPPPAPVFEQPEQPKGTHVRTYYAAEVVDKRKLIEAVAAGEVPDNVLTPDMTVLNGLARSLKHGLKYAGVRVVEDTKPVTRS